MLLKHVAEQLHENKHAYRDLRAALDALLLGVHEMTVAIRSNTDELSALRSMRTQNGHAKNDNLEGESP